MTLGKRIIGMSASITTAETAEFASIKYVNGRAGFITLDTVMTMPAADFAQQEPGIAAAINKTIIKEGDALELYREADFGRDLHINANSAAPLRELFENYNNGAELKKSLPF